MLVDSILLLERLREFESDLKDDEVAREFFGFVSPAIARLRISIAKARLRIPIAKAEGRS